MWILFKKLLLAQFQTVDVDNDDVMRSISIFEISATYVYRNTFRFIQRDTVVANQCF